MCLNVGNGSGCFASCLTCSDNSYCGVEDACTSCYPGEYKISANFNDITFKCSTECNGDAYEHDNYFYCDRHIPIITKQIRGHTRSSSSVISETNHEILIYFIIIFFVINGIIFMFVIIKIVLKIKRKYLNVRNTLEPEIEMQPLNSARDVAPQQAKKTYELKKTSNFDQTHQQTFKKLEMINVEDFEKGEVISGGSFSVVYERTLRGTPVAIKVARDEGRRSIHKELKTYDKISHPHILSALGVHFGVDNMLFLALRKYNLKDYFLNYGNAINFQQLKQYCIQIADGMKYLHNKNILHCDLKIDNILVKDDNCEYVEISDFGSAIDLASDHETKLLCTETHAAYEILVKSIKKLNISTPISKASDVWAFAVTMWQIFQKSFELPIDFIKPEDIVKNYETGKKLPLPVTASEDFWRYNILPCFDLHPKARPSMEDLHKCLLRYREESTSGK